jgi:hypothetical protein
MWYEILVKNNFADYFMNSDSNAQDESTTLQMLDGYADIVSGVTISWMFFDKRDPDFVSGIISNEDQHIKLAFEFCHSRLDSTTTTNLGEVWSSIPVNPDQSCYDIDTNLLNAEQCAVLIMYPFWSRMGGSFEKEFAIDGRLKKYLCALNNKCNNN